MILRLLKSICLGVLLIVISCGVSEKKIAKCERKLEELQIIGVPDTLLSKARVLLYQAKDSQSRGHFGIAKQAYKDLKKELNTLEGSHKEKVNQIRATIDSLSSVVRTARNNLTGLQLKKLDSMMVPVDTFLNKKWYLHAYDKLKKVGDAIPKFYEMEKLSKELRNVIPGEWVFTQHTKGKEAKDINLLEKKVFTFTKDGKVVFVESRKGQSGPYLKEDAEYKSIGTYDIYGDTIYLFVNRFIAVRQNFKRLYIEDGGKKKIWKDENHPTYDSTITDGSQDRYIAYADLKEDFQQVKKY
ncbi:MAG: hypothetical protein N2053_02855 [Chitinispirillaceae bacterium]|nr:hypothetical protein [Chitinispirillaceae bacterium]